MSACRIMKPKSSYPICSQKLIEKELILKPLFNYKNLARDKLYQQDNPYFTIEKT